MCDKVPKTPLKIINQSKIRDIRRFINVISQIFRNFMPEFSSQIGKRIQYLKLSTL